MGPVERTESKQIHQGDKVKLRGVPGRKEPGATKRSGTKLSCRGGSEAEAGGVGELVGGFLTEGVKHGRPRNTPQKGARRSPRGACRSEAGSVVCAVLVHGRDWRGHLSQPLTPFRGYSVDCHLSPWRKHAAGVVRENA